MSDLESLSQFIFSTSETYAMMILACQMIQTYQTSLFTWSIVGSIDASITAFSIRLRNFLSAAVGRAEWSEGPGTTKYSVAIENALTHSHCKLNGYVGFTRLLWSLLEYLGIPTQLCRHLFKYKPPNFQHASTCLEIPKVCPRASARDAENVEEKQAS